MGGIRFRRCDGLDERGVYECGGDGHEAGDADDYAAVAFETEEFSFYAFEDASRDAHPITLSEVQLGDGEIKKLFVLCTGYGYEVLHVGFRYGEGRVGFPVHVIAGRDRCLQFFFESVYGVSAAMHEEQVVDHRNGLFDALPVATDQDGFLHGQEVFDSIPVEIFFKKHLPTIGYSHHVPSFFIS